MKTCDSCEARVPKTTRTKNGFSVCPACRNNLLAIGADLNPAWVKAGPEKNLKFGDGKSITLP